MSSFVADCPRGHKGNFVTHLGYHVCFCGLHIPVFKESQESVTERVEDTIEEETGTIKQDYEDTITKLEDRLMVVDPEFDR